MFKPMLSSSRAIYRRTIKINGIRCSVNDGSEILRTYQEIEYYLISKMDGNNKTH